MMDKKEILKTVKCLRDIYSALKEYKALIDDMLSVHNIYDITIFNTLPAERAHFRCI